MNSLNTSNFLNNRKDGLDALDRDYAQTHFWERIPAALNNAFGDNKVELILCTLGNCKTVQTFMHNSKFGSMIAQYATPDNELSELVYRNIIEDIYPDWEYLTA